MTLDELLGPASEPVAEPASRKTREHAGDLAGKQAHPARRFEEMSLDELLDFDGAQRKEPPSRVSVDDAKLDELLAPEPAPPPRNRKSRKTTAASKQKPSK